MKTTKIAVSAGVALMVAFGFAVRLPPPPDRHPQEAILRTLQSPSQVRVEARIERNVIFDDAGQTVTVTVSNYSHTTLSSLALSLIASGFAWNQSPGLHCTENGVVQSDLAGQRSCTFTVRVSAASRSGVYGIAARLSWQESGVPKFASLTLDPVTIDRPWGAAAWSRGARRIAGIVKDLALPVILVLIGAFLADRQKSADLKRAEAEKAREDARIAADKARQEARIAAEESKEKDRQEAERKRDEANAVRNQLLSRVMETARNHYLPVVNQAKRTLAEAKKIRDGHAEASRERALFHLLLLLKRMETFRLAEGGFFFQTRAGERAVTAAWYLVRFRVYPAMGHQAIADALAQVDTSWSDAVFGSKIALFPDLLVTFSGWVSKAENSADLQGSFWQILGPLDAFQALTAFETDRPLSDHWYDEKGELSFQLAAPTVLYETKPMDDVIRSQLERLKTELDGEYKRSTTILPV